MTDSSSIRVMPVQHDTLFFVGESYWRSNHPLFPLSLSSTPILAPSKTIFLLFLKSIRGLWVSRPLFVHWQSIHSCRGHNRSSAQGKFLRTRGICSHEEGEVVELDSWCGGARGSGRSVERGIGKGTHKFGGCECLNFISGLLRLRWMLFGLHGISYFCRWGREIRRHLFCYSR